MASIGSAWVVMLFPPSGSDPAEPPRSAGSDAWRRLVDRQHRRQSGPGPRSRPHPPWTNLWLTPMKAGRRRYQSACCRLHAFETPIHRDRPGPQRRASATRSGARLAQASPRRRCLRAGILRPRAGARVLRSSGQPSTHFPGTQPSHT